MRSINTIHSGCEAKEEYYTEDESLKDTPEDYYADAEIKSTSKTMTQAIWHGKGAYALGLSGDVQRQDFKTVFYGCKPGTNERIRGIHPDPNKQERLAYDLTLSAPKSISMALHLGGDERLFDAHLDAVKETLDLVESMYAQARVTLEGERVVIPTGNLLAAIIPHHTSRELDMQLHSHCVIMNGTLLKDGRWFSLWHEGIIDAEWLGSQYRNALAQKVQALGYEIYETRLDEGCSFEIQGYDREVIETFSKRSRQIIESLERQGLEVNAENRDGAVLTTRKTKQVEETLEEFQTRLRSEATTLGLNLVEPQLEAVPSLGHRTAKQEIDSAIRHLSEFSVSFSEGDLYKYALNHIQRFTVEDMTEAIAQRQDLLQTKTGRLMTVDALEREIATLRKWQVGQGQAQAIMDFETAKAALEGTSLNPGQYETVLKVASATDRHLIIQGLSGVGKTHAMGELKQLIEASGQGITIKGYSPTIKAAQQLQRDMGIETNTVESLVRREPEPMPNQLWVIDEAGMVSATQMLSILEKADAVGARILLVGDIGQNPSVKAGSPMRSLMQNGATTFRLSEIIRQQNSVQRRAVELIANGQPVEALSLLSEHGHVQELSSQKQRVQAIAEQYLSLDLSERSKTLIVTGTNAERQAITQSIRAGLKAEGSLGEERTVLQLVNQYMSTEQKRRVENFEPGCFIRLLRDYKKTPLLRNKLYQVIGRDGAELIVSTEGGRLYRFDPSKCADKEVFKTAEFAVAVGDRLRWTGSNKSEGQVNGAEFTVIGMREQHLIVADEKGTKIINANQPLGVDYALVSTSYRAQGQTAKRVIVSATIGPTAAKEPFYVKISRQTHEIQVYAEDMDKLKDWVQRSIAQDNALDLIGDPYGSSPVSGDNATAQSAIKPDAATQPATEPDSGATGAESPDADTAQQQYEHHPDHHPRRDGLIPDGVRRATGEPEALGGSGRNSGTDRNLEGAEGPTDELGTDTRRHDLTGELRHGGDSELRDAVAQQRLDASAAKLKSSMERVISSLTVLGNDELVHDSAIVESTREVVEALEPIVSSLEGQPSVTPPKRDLTSAMARVINGLTAMDSEDVFGESEIIAEIKSLVERVEAHTIAQEQLTQHTNSGDHHVGQNSSRESARTTVRRDSGVESHARIARTESDRAASSTERHSADLEPAARGSARAAVPDRDAGAERHDPELARHDRRADQSAAQASRGQERDLPAHEAEFSHLPATAQHRRVEHRDVGSEPGTARNERRSPASADQRNGPEQTGTIATRLFNRATDGISARADAIVRIRLERELAEPLAQLRATLARIREVNQLNERLKAEFDARQSSIDAHQAELAAEGKSITAQKERLFAQMEVQLAQSKVEVLDTTLTEWRSLRQEPELHQIPELAVAPSDRAELTNLIANYPAQKVIDYAMAEYAQVRQHFELGAIGDAKHQSPASATKMPTPRTTSPPKPKQSTAAPGRAASPPKPKPRIQRNPTPRPEKRVPIVAFWQPDYVEARRPHLLEPKHWEEFKRSAIHPELILARFESVEDKAVFDRLFSDKFATMGAGQKSTRAMERMMDEFAQVAEGAWWYKAGKKVLDFPSLATGQKPEVSTGGSLKPNEENRREDTKKTLKKREKDPNAPTEYIKYENPVGPKQTLFERDLFFGDVPNEIAEGIYQKYGVTPSAEERAMGFWYVVYKHVEIPIYRVEGAKKDAAITSQGRAVIGGHGINAGYRANDLQNNKLKRRLLHPQLEIFAQPGREFRFANDQDESVSTILNVRRDTVREAELLEERGSTPLNIKWDGKNERKGADDLIAKDGPLAFESADQNAYPMQREAKIYYRTQYNALSKEVRKAKPGIAGEALDIEVYLLAITKGELKDGERFLSQSDHARSLKDPAQVTAYIEHIKASVPQYLQHQREIERAQAAAVAQRQQELDAAKAVAHAAAQRQKELVDAQAAVQAQQKREFAAAQAAAQAKALAQQQPVIDRANYEKLAQQVRNQLIEVSPTAFDAVVYKWAQAKGLDAEQVLMQSDQALQLKNSHQIEAYLSRVHKLSQRVTEKQGPDTSDQQSELNIRALHSCGELINLVGITQEDGSRCFDANLYLIQAKQNECRLYSTKDKRVLLELKDNRLVGSVTPKIVKHLEDGIQHIEAAANRKEKTQQRTPRKDVGFER